MKAFALGFKLDLTISLPPPPLCDEAEDGVGREEEEEDTETGVVTAEEGGTVDGAKAGERTIEGPLVTGARAPANGDDSFFEYAPESACAPPPPPIGTTVIEGTACGVTEEAAGEFKGVVIDCGPAIVPALGEVSFFENESALVIPASLIFDGVPGVSGGGGV